MPWQKIQLVHDLAASTGVSEEDVAAVLDELGLGETLTELSQRFGEDAMSTVARTDLRISIRLGRLLVAA